MIYIQTTNDHPIKNINFLWNFSPLKHFARSKLLSLNAIKFYFDFIHCIKIILLCWAIIPKLLLGIVEILKLSSPFVFADCSFFREKSDFNNKSCSRMIKTQIKYVRFPRLGKRARERTNEVSKQMVFRGHPAFCRFIVEINPRSCIS